MSPDLVSRIFFFSKMKNILTLSFACFAFARIAPLLTNGELIDDEYIVMLKEPASFNGDSAAYVNAHISKLFENFHFSDKDIIHKYHMGYSAKLDSVLLNKLQAMDDVDYVEQNQVVHHTDIQENPKNWGLDRISQRHLPLSKQYDHDPNGGENVDCYIVDTGVNVDHSDFEGRAVWGLTAPNGDPDEDGNGHGTHVASTVAGKEYGVAKKCRIIAVKVLRSNGYGTTADVIRGIEWTVEQHEEKVAKKSKEAVKSVANMSLGGGRSAALNNAVDRAVAKGVVYAVAAGNENSNACNSSPAGAASAITVGSTANDDSRSYFSNWGTCVDIFAPGSMITAAWTGCKDCTRTISGTSMASPHVCGVLALLLSHHENMTTNDLKAKLIELSTKDALKDVGRGSPNKLLYIPPFSGKEEESSVMKENRSPLFEIVFKIMGANKY
jgi:cerevisin